MIKNNTWWLIIIACVFVLSGCGSGSSGEGRSSNAVLNEIQISPVRTASSGSSDLRLAVNNMQQFRAIAIYDDGTTEDITRNVNWAASSSSVRMSDRGGATAEDVGQVRITAEIDGTTSNSIELVVTNALLETIQITFERLSSAWEPHIGLAKGNSRQLIATGIYDDGTSVDITEGVEWISSDNDYASVSLGGLVTGVEPGIMSFQANLYGITSNAAYVTVNSATLTHIEISPLHNVYEEASELRLPKGNSLQLVAMGTYSDDSIVDISDSVLWRNRLSYTGVNADGLVDGKNEGLGYVSASKDGVTSNELDILVTSVKLTRIELTPSTSRLFIGNTQQLIATAWYSDNSTVDITNSVNWYITSIDNVRVDSDGLATGVAEGNSSISVSQAGINSNTVNISVENPTLTSIQVISSVSSIAKGNSQQLVAMGIYSNGSSVDITNSVTWLREASSNNIVVIGHDGLVFGNDAGITKISAQKDGILSHAMSFRVTAATLSDIQISPDINSIAIGNKYQLIATGIYSDGTSTDITNSVRWQSNNDKLKVNQYGVITAMLPGSANISAIKSEIEGNLNNISVTEANLETITVTPANTNIIKGSVQSLQATGIYSDGSTVDVSQSVSWISNDRNIVSVSVNGVATGIESGETTISAIKGGVSSNMISIEVTAPNLTEIKITPRVLVNVAKGNREQFTAIGVYDDGTESDISSNVNWRSENTDIAIVDRNGLATGIAFGHTDIVATLADVDSSPVSIQVLDAILEQIQISSYTAEFSLGDHLTLNALGIYSDESSIDLNGVAWYKGVTWHSDDVGIITISQNGVLTGLKEGTASVYATKTDIYGLVLTSNSINVTVTPGLPNIGICGGAPDNIDRENAEGVCLKVVVDRTGKWFTSSPSIAVMAAREYSLAPGDSGEVKTYSATTTEDGSKGPAGRTFARFDQLGGTDEGVYGQYDRWCQDLNSMNFGGKSNWRRAKGHEIQEVFVRGNGSLWDGSKSQTPMLPLHHGYGWPVGERYWIGESNDRGWFYASDFGDYFYSSVINSGTSYYATCVSEP